MYWFLLSVITAIIHALAHYIARRPQQTLSTCKDCEGGDEKIAYTRNRTSKVLKSIFVYVSAILFVTALFSPAFYEYPGINEKSEESPASEVWWFNNDGDFVNYPYGKFEWGEKNSFINVPKGEINFSDILSLSLKSENRIFKYSFTCEMINPQKFYFHKKERLKIKEIECYQPNYKTIQQIIIDIVRNLKFEFSNSNLEKFTDFYNPSSNEQQKTFDSLLNGWMNKGLSKQGLIIKSKGFRISKKIEGV